MNDPQYADLIATLHAVMVYEIGGEVEEAELRSRVQLAKGYPGKTDRTTMNL